MSGLIDDLRNQENLSLKSWVLKQWEKKITIAVVLFIATFCGISFASRTNLFQVAKEIDFLEWVLIGLFLLGIFLLWFYSRRPPRITKNKIGIVIAIVCENKKERQRLKADFISTLKTEFTKAQTSSFQILELSEYHAGRIDSGQSALKYHKSTRAHLIIYGHCRIRSHKGAENYVIDIEASVAHSPIPDLVSKELSQEMRTLIPKQRIFPVSEEITGFSITRELMAVAARYIVGLAGLLSGDIQTSFNLHSALWVEIKALLETEGEVLQGYIFLQTKLPTRLMIEGLTLASTAYRSKESGYLQKMDRYLNLVQEVDPRNYSAHLLRGIYHFLNDRNITKAKEEIRKSRNERDAAWQFSDAFLAAYEGDLEQAHKIYQRAFRGNVREPIPLVVETFINDVLSEEPERIQLWYCLGMINYFSKEDLSLAKRDFEKFVSEANKRGIFSKSVEFALKYIAEIKKTDSNPVVAISEER